MASNNRRQQESMGFEVSVLNMTGLPYTLIYDNDKAIEVGPEEDVVDHFTDPLVMLPLVPPTAHPAERAQCTAHVKECGGVWHAPASRRGTHVDQRRTVPEAAGGRLR